MKCRGKNNRREREELFTEIKLMNIINETHNETKQ